MPRTHTELIDELTKRVDTISLALERVRSGTLVELDHLGKGLKDLQDTVRELVQVDAKLAERVAVLEQRCVSLEKSSDRTWQLAPIIVSAVAVVVSLIVAFVKK